MTRKSIVLFLVLLISGCASRSLLLPEERTFLKKSLAANDSKAQMQGNSPLYYAAKAGDFAAVKALLEQGADPKMVNSGDASGMMTALHAVSLFRGKSFSGPQPHDAEIVKLLTEKGADPNYTDKYVQLTPLAYAEFQDATHLIGPLLAAGADPNRKSVYQDSPPLCLTQNPVIIETLLRAGADPRVLNQSGKNAFDCYAIYPDAYAALMKHGHVDPGASARTIRKGTAAGGPVHLNVGKYYWARETRPTAFTADPKKPQPFYLDTAVVELTAPLTEAEAISRLVPERLRRQHSGRTIVLEGLFPCGSAGCDSAIAEFTNKRRAEHAARGESLH